MFYIKQKHFSESKLPSNSSSALCSAILVAASTHTFSTQCELVMSKLSFKRPCNFSVAPGEVTSSQQPAVSQSPLSSLLLILLTVHSVSRENSLSLQQLPALKDVLFTPKPLFSSFT
ncbi:hypothetical protein AMECASPLE_022376 [Ameca splendens]|uniref:Uncharacterized protein n=1 Tax=Ameca splendens TaxID=208324 RepID=A0ABV0YF21_9TELE